MAQPGTPVPDPGGDNDNPNYSIWPNVGQVVNDLGDSVPSIAYYTEGFPQTYFQTNGLISFVYSTRDTVAGVDTLRRLDLTCAGPNANYPDPTTTVLRNHVANFDLPQCGPGGATGVPAYGRTTYMDEYPGIDLQVYSGLGGQRLAFVVNPAGDPNDIQLLVQGQDSMVVDTAGNLRLMMDGQWVVLPEAVTFQTDSASTIFPLSWTASYQVINDSTVTFGTGYYDQSKPLVFVMGPPPALTASSYDTPGLCWSTYYGGKHFDFPKDVQADKDGNIYVAGRSESDFAQFPHATGNTNILSGQSFATLTKFNPLHELQWTIYHGGQPGSANTLSRSQGVAVGIKEDPTRVYMVGITDADDFLTLALPGAYNDGTGIASTNKGFVARYDGVDGDLQWATYIGQSDVEVQAMDVQPTTGQIMISGTTRDDLGLGNYLPHFGPYQFNVNHGGKDAFVAVFDGNDALDWSAYYGGADDEGRALVRCLSDDIVLAGNTRSANLPVYWSGSYFHQNYQGNQDVFVVQFSLVGIPEWSTYFGGPLDEDLAPQGMSMPRDLFLTGTCGPLAPALLVNGTGWYDDVPAWRNGFIARFQVNTRIPKWITYLGNGALDQHNPFCIDAGGSSSPITIGGFTDDGNFPSQPGLGYYYQPGIVPDHTATNPVKDGFLVRFDQAQNLQWASYFGGQGGTMTAPENVTAVLNLGNSVYAVGYSSRHVAGDIRIPLDGDPNDPMFFNQFYNYNGQTNDYSDGFIVEFCNDTPTAKSALAGTDVIEERDDLQVAWSPTGELALLGLADGPHTLRVYDAQGRVVLDQTVGSTAGRSETVRLPDSSAALYLLVVDNQRTGRLVPIR